MAREAMCGRHTDAVAVGRCRHCNRPMCEKCLVTADGESFCSKDCAGQYTGFRATHAGKEKKGGGLVMLLVKLVVAVALVLGGFFVAAKVFHVKPAQRLLHVLGLGPAETAEDAPSPAPDR